MSTHCSDAPLRFQPLVGRRVEADFQGQGLTAEGGGLLLREADAAAGGIIQRFAGCFGDGRAPERIEHTVEQLLSQRVHSLCLGYEDLNDHDSLSRDPLLATLAGKADPLGRDRRREADRGQPLASRSTLNRFESGARRGSGRAQGPLGIDPYRPIHWNADCLDRTLAEIFLESFDKPPERVILDLDATDDPLHGQQEGRFFQGYYRHYCYLPLYIFCGQHLLRARLRPSNIDAPAGSIEELEPLVAQIRERWPDVRIWLRGDSGFCRDWLMSWCEDNGVEFVFGLARNNRLSGQVRQALDRAKAEHEKTGQPARNWEDFDYETLNSWRGPRRVIAKAEHLPGKANPRFIATSLDRERFPDPRHVYEDIYCARGEMENRIKEQQLDLFADRTSCHRFDANQLRLYFSAIAYTLMLALRRLGLAGTGMEKAQSGTIRDRLLKVGASVLVSVRRVLVRLSCHWPGRRLFERVRANLRLAAAARGHPIPAPAPA